MVELNGKRLTVFYNDTPSHVMVHEAILTSVDDDNYWFGSIAIPKSKVIRIEVVE